MITIMVFEKIILFSRLIGKRFSFRMRPLGLKEFLLTNFLNSPNQVKFVKCSVFILILKKAPYAL